MVDLANISGIQKIAAFLLSREPEEASRILKTMPTELVSRVAEAMTALDPALSGFGVAEALVDDLARALNRPRNVQACDQKELERLLTSALGDQGRTILNGLTERRREDHPFFELERFSDGAIATVLRQESPAVAALVLAHLKPVFSARILGFFPADSAKEVVRRIANLDLPNASMLRGIAEELLIQVSTLPPVPASADTSTRLRSVAEILSNSSTEVEKAAIESIGDENPEMANELRDYMFTWEDLGKVGKRDMQKILGSVNTKTLAVALKGCPAAVEENLLGNLSSRVREMVTEERDIAGPMAMSDVLGSREEILLGIRAMLETGELKLTRGGEALVE